MSIKMAVLDIAGTTVEDEGSVANAFRNAFVKNGYEISLEDSHPYMGVKKIAAVRQMLEKLGEEFTDDDVVEIHTDFVSEMVDYYSSDPSVKPFADTEQVFEELKGRGIRVVLNTGFPRIIADTIIDRFQWMKRGLIDDYIASDEVETGRPSALMITVLMQRAGISDPAQVAKVGDTFIDIEEGKNAGCKYVVAVTTGSGSAEELSGYQPTHLLHHLSELPGILQ